MRRRLQQPPSVEGVGDDDKSQMILHIQAQHSRFGDLLDIGPGRARRFASHEHRIALQRNPGAGAECQYYFLSEYCV